MDPVKFGRVLRGYRIDAHLDQAELGTRVGVSQGTVSNWERGKAYPDPNHVALLASVFGVHPDRLFDHQLSLATDVERAIVDDTSLTRKEQDALLAHYGAVTGRLSGRWAEWLRGERRKKG